MGPYLQLEGVHLFGWVESTNVEGDKLRTTLPETNSSHLKIGDPKRKRIVFQPSIFRCENVSFREGIGDGFNVVFFW